MATHSIPHKTPLQIVLFVFLALFVLAFLSHGDEAPEVLRRGLFTEITDGDAGDYHFERYDGFQAFRMSADGSTVVFYRRDDAMTTESLRMMDTDGANETVIYERTIGDDGALLISDCFDISDNGRYVGYVLAWGPGVGQAKQVVIYDAQADVHHYMPTQVEVQLYGQYEVGYVDFALRNTPENFCLSGDGQTAFILNDFGLFLGGIPEIEPSGKTFFAFTIGELEAQNLLAERGLLQIDGRDERAVCLGGAGGWLDANFDGSVFAFTAGGFPHDPIPVHWIVCDASGYRILLDLDARGWSGASLSGDGSTAAFCRWGWESDAMNGLFVVSINDRTATQVFEGDLNYGLYPVRPHITNDGTAIVFSWPHSNNQGLFYAKTDGSLILPLTAGAIAYPEPDAYPSEDGSMAMLKGAVNPQGGFVSGPDLIKFAWREKGDTAFVPNIVSVTADPHDDFALYDGLQPAFYHRMLYAAAGTNLSIAYSIPIASNGLRPGSARGFDWPGVYDNGNEEDAAAGDGVYTDSYVWMHTDFTEPYVTVRGAITNTTGAAGFVDVLMNTRQIVPCDAAFTVDVTEGPVPLTVTCTDASTGDVLTWSWDCDGVWPPEYEDPAGPVVHTYTEAGVYTMRLTVDGFGGEDTAEVVITVYAARDIDGSGSVDAVDVQLVINAVLGLSIGNLNADVNGDGSEDAVDVQLVINGALGIL